MHIRKWHTMYHFKLVHIILIYSLIFTLQERMCQHANLSLNTSCHYYCGFSYQRLDQWSPNCAVLPVTTKLQEHFCPPVYPSVRLSVCHNFSQCSSDCNNMKNYITIDKSDVYANGQNQRSKSERSKQILPQFESFRTVSPVWIYRWLPNDARNLQWHGIWSLLF